MKILLAVLFSISISVFGAETNIQVVSTIKTNFPGELPACTEELKLDGQTILLRYASTNSDGRCERMQRFYYHGIAVGEVSTGKANGAFDASVVTSFGTPYTFQLSYCLNKPCYATIATKNGSIVAAYAATNNLFYPTKLTGR